ncbi:Eco57I restriction-modification methylase domain-containing protein [Microbacterium sp. NPDC057650]|uniref:Eco57I restriction-modification methylase domain-containing protein n=1 Tax=unclassified Microbacterium TaxID=2609290 RepID=UPI003671B416
MAVDVWEWLSLIDHDGPFLSKAALKSFYPSGLPRPAVDETGDVFVDEFVRWSAAWSATAEVYGAARDRWVAAVLRRLLDWSDDLQLSPVGLAAQSPNGAVTVTPWAALTSDDGPAALVTLVHRVDDLRSAGTDGWSANAIDRMAVLLRETGVTIGIVTDGRWWALVSAAKDVTTASGVWDALLWREERPSRDAFLALASYSSIAGGAAEMRLPLVFAKSVASAEEITEALGDQVRRAVELVLQSMSDTHLRAVSQGDRTPLPEDPKTVYEGAVTVLMRIVFLLFAEERGLLPEHDLYRSSYAIAQLREQLQQDAQATSEEALDHSWEAWHRLLAASNAVFGGASFQDMRMPAYGGSLFDPARFPWLHATDQQGRLRVRLTDRAMLAVLRAVQTIEDGAMQLSFRDLDVEQIGYVYEGLLGYSAAYVPDVTVGLDGRSGFEPEIALAELEEIKDAASSPADFAKRLVDHLKKTQEQSKPRTPNQIAKAYGAGDLAAAADARTRLRHALLGDDELATRLEPFHGLIRNDLRGFPYAIPAGGLVMTESPQRANTGTHYTPRSLAEEVVLHALEPLVYSPGPLDTENRSDWRLKSSSEILDLKIADIAAGSGAFLVAAARYLADRLIEARANEGLDVSHESDLKRWAVREVVARCLYGADINGMAVEMCKLSLWLISMDAGKPFSFVDDRVFHGNSLLGVTTEEQLKAQHIYPERRRGREQLPWFDVDKDLDDAARIRRELASGQVDDADRMRSTKAKQALLRQAERVTLKLRDVADGIVAVGLLEGGKPGKKLDDRYDDLADALRAAYPDDGTEPDRAALDAIIEVGLTPIVDIGDARWAPLHWILAAPDVIHDHGGFDAIVGNPAFYHSKKITTGFGKNYRDTLQSTVAFGKRGDADLAAYFLLRQAALLRQMGCIGVVITKSIMQSHTKVVGLDQVLAAGARLIEVSDPFDWGPRGADVSVVKAWLVKLPEAATTSHLAAEPKQPLGLLPVRSYVGTYPNGDGFRVPADRALRWLADDERLASRVHPYIRAADLSQGDPSRPGEYLIDLDGLPEVEAREYATLWRHLEAFQRPWRSRPSVKPRLQQNWWHFESAAAALYSELSNATTAIAIPRTSNLLMPLWVDPRSMFDMGVVVFPGGDLATYAQIASSLHYHWVLEYAATTRDDPSYAPKRLANTFPWTPSSEIGAASREFSEELAELCVKNGGLRPVMNSMNDHTCVSPDISDLRELFVNLDSEVFRAFGWSDLTPAYDFVTIRNLTRFTVDEGSQREILDRLIQENHRRAESEAEIAPLNKSKRGRRFEESAVPEGAMF